MLAANGGTTMGQEGYGTGGAYSAVEDDGSSLAKTIVQYAERTSTAEAHVSDLESQSRPSKWAVTNNRHKRDIMLPIQHTK